MAPPSGAGGGRDGSGGGSLDVDGGPLDAARSSAAAALVSRVPGVHSSARLGGGTGGDGGGAKRPSWRTSRDDDGAGGRQLSAVDAAMLATAFAAACPPGQQTIPLSSLSATLKRAGIDGADLALPQTPLATQLTGHVALDFAEVSEIAQKLKALQPSAATATAPPEATWPPEAAFATAASVSASLASSGGGGGSYTYDHAPRAPPASAQSSLLASLPPPRGDVPSSASLYGAPPPLSDEMRVQLAHAFALSCGSDASALPVTALHQVRPTPGCW